MTRIDEIKARKIAQKITNYLFRNGDGEQADRLVLELPTHRGGGGWGRKPAEDAIARILLKETE
jgi:hypothetical protein